MIIDHGAGMYSGLYHMDRIAVAIGQIVRRGETVGQMGATGLVTGSNLHWEMRVNAFPVDPRAHLGRPLVDKSRYYSILEELYRDARR